MFFRKNLEIVQFFLSFVQYLKFNQKRFSMEEYNKILDTMVVKFVRARKLDVVQPVVIRNFSDVYNTLIVLNEGMLAYGEEQTPLEAGSILFIPAGKHETIYYGNPNKAIILSNEEFLHQKDRFLKTYEPASGMGESVPNLTYFSFDARVFESVNFFNSLDLPPFVLKNAAHILQLMDSLMLEDVNNEVGKAKLTHIYSEQILINILRYLIRNDMFVEKIATNISYFKDIRLIDMYHYIKDQLNGDLSNKVLATVATVSEDYVGQYFKMLTGMNPQDYIEYQRMCKAIVLLQEGERSIRAIGNDIGYKDTAYFCRRFKMMFGIPAGKMRRRDFVGDGDFEDEDEE